MSYLSYSASGNQNEFLSRMAKNSLELRNAILGTFEREMVQFAKKYDVPYEVFRRIGDETLKVGRVPSNLMHQIEQEENISRETMFELGKYVQINLLGIYESDRNRIHAILNEWKRPQRNHSQFNLMDLGSDRPSNSRSIEFKKVQKISRSSIIAEDFENKPLGSRRKIYDKWFRSLRNGDRCVVKSNGIIEEGVIISSGGMFRVKCPMNGVKVFRKKALSNPGADDGLYPSGSWLAESAKTLATFVSDKFSDYKKECPVNLTDRHLTESFMACLESTLAVKKAANLEESKRLKGSAAMAFRRIRSFLKNPYWVDNSKVRRLIDVCESTVDNFYLIESMIDVDDRWSVDDIHCRKREMLSTAKSLLIQLVANKDLIPGNESKCIHENYKIAASMVGYASMSDQWWLNNQDRIDRLMSEEKRSNQLSDILYGE